MAPHCSTLAWKIPWAEEPSGLQSMGLRRVGHDWATSLSLFTFMHWRRKWQSTPVFLPGGSQGRGSLVGCRLWGRTESDMTEVTYLTLRRQAHRVMWPRVMRPQLNTALCPADLTSWDRRAAMPPGSWSPAHHEELTQRNERLLSQSWQPFSRSLLIIDFCRLPSGPLSRQLVELSEHLRRLVHVTCQRSNYVRSVSF